MKAIDALGSYFVEQWKIDKDLDFEVEFVDPKQFLTKNRFDLACKLFYIDAKIRNKNRDLATDIYREHIKCFSNGTFSEDGSPEKNSMEKFLSDFDNLIDSIQNKGFDENISVVPVDATNNIINGSHRTAIAIYFNMKLPIVRIGKSFTRMCFDFSFFSKRGMGNKYLSLIASLFVKYSPTSYIAFLWPSVRKSKYFEAAHKVILNYGNAVFFKDVRLSFRGVCQLMTHLYGEQAWTGGYTKKFINVVEKAYPCFKENSDTRIYVLCNRTNEEIFQLKQTIRDIFLIENHSIHISDSKEEAIEAAKLVLFDNSINVLNHCYILSDNIDVAKMQDLNKRKYKEDFFIESGSSKDASTILNRRQDYKCSKIDFIADYNSLFYCFGNLFISDYNTLKLLDKNIFLSKSPYERKYKNIKNRVFNQKIRSVLRRIKK